MRFAAEQELFAERLQEVRALHQTISELEGSDALRPDSTRALILRGLFFVLLYGCFESAVNRLVSATLREISSLGVQTPQLEASVFSLALDSNLSSLEGGVNRSKWKKRIDLFQAQASHSVCTINDTIMGLYLQNIGRASLEQVLGCLGIAAAAVPSPRHIGYVDELVEKRRAVSHGRSSAEEVGRAYRSPELLLRITAISEVVAHLESTFSEYLEQRMYISAPYR